MVYHSAYNICATISSTLEILFIFCNFIAPGGAPPSRMPPPLMAMPTQGGPPARPMMGGQYSLAHLFNLVPNNVYRDMYKFTIKIRCTARQFKKGERTIKIKTYYITV